MAIITISRQVGSLGDKIAKAAADKLGYKYLDKTQLSETLSSCGLPLSDIDKYDEKKPSLWQNLSRQKELFSQCIRASVCEFAAQNDVLILGRGGQVILKDIPGALHVRVIAPFETRVSRLMDQTGEEKKIVERLIRQSDSDSSGYLSTYFDSNIDANGLYDLVINTRSLTLNESVEMIARAAGAEKIKVTPEISEKLNDFALNYTAKAALLEFADNVEWVDVEVDNGIALVTGLVSSPTIKNKCENTLINIKGITSVENKLNIRDAETSIYYI